MTSMTVAETPSAPLIITLFGPMQVLVDGNPIPRPRSRKTLRLFALLTLRHNRPVEREWLTGVFWPDMDPPQAFANLRPILSELRSGLGSQKERLQSPDRHTLLLDLTGAEVDLLSFDAAIKSGQLSELERAVALYQGPLLEGCYEEWVSPERSVRDLNCLQALLKLANAARTTGNLETAVGFFQRAATLDPWSDTARRGWMEALAQMGDSNAALLVYRKYVEALRSDPKATPDQETTLLYQRLRADAQQQTVTPVTAPQMAAPPPVIGYLPHPLTDLVGREDEQIEVAARLRRSRLVTLVGLGGIGKTRLAIATASEIVQEYADGVWLVALEALSEGKQVAQQIASVMGLQEKPHQSPLQRVTDHLCKRQLLLVLDNCEHLLMASAQAADHLLRECANVHILATSREALGITGETVWAVPALTTPDPTHLPQACATLLRVLRGYESVQLFVERAQAIQKTFALNGENAAAVAQIGSKLEGIPLAIELAAARVNALTVEQIAARLDDHLALLTGGSRTVMSRQQTLRATLDWSHAQLSQSEQILLRRLSVFAGGWTLQAAEAVCVGREIQAREMLDLLTALVAKSLILFEEGQEGGRYRMLEIVRQYAAERLNASEEAQEAETKHRDWFVALSEAAELELRSARKKIWIHRLTADYDNLRLAMSRCGSDASGIEAGLRMTGALSQFWSGRYAYREGRAHLQAALGKGGTPSPTREWGKALHALGLIIERQGEPLLAREHLEKALHIHEQIGDRQGIGASLHTLGSIALTLGDMAAGQAFLDQSVAIRREVGDRYGIAISLESLGWLALRTADFEKAKSLYEESLALFRECGDQDKIAISLRYLGVIAKEFGEYALAERLLEEALYLFTDLGNRREEAFTLHALAGMANSRRLFDTAQTHYQASLSLLSELGDRNGVATTSRALGMVALSQKDPKAAHAYLAEGLQIYREIGNKTGVANSLHGLGILAHQSGDFAAAYTALDESLQTLHDLRDKRGVVIQLEERAGLLLEQAEIEAAVRLMGASQRLREEMSLPASLNAQANRESLLVRIHATLDSDAVSALWEEGCAMSLDQAVTFALSSGHLHTD